MLYQKILLKQCSLLSHLIMLPALSFIWKDCFVKCLSRELIAEISEKFHTDKSHTIFHVKILCYTHTTEIRACTMLFVLLQHSFLQCCAFHVCNCANHWNNLFPTLYPLDKITGISQNSAKLIPPLESKTLHHHR